MKPHRSIAMPSPLRVLPCLSLALLSATACRKTSTTGSSTVTTPGALIPGTFITTGGTFTLTEGKTVHTLDVTQSGTSLSLDYSSSEELPSGGSTGDMMGGSTSLSSPADPWFVFVETPQRFWYFEGKSELSILHMFDDSDGRVISAGKATHPESAKVPPAVVLRLPEDLRKLLPPAGPPVKRPGL
jgi:hypothetical protein